MRGGRRDWMDFEEREVDLPPSPHTPPLHHHHSTTDTAPFLPSSGGSLNMTGLNRIN